MREWGVLIILVCVGVLVALYPLRRNKKALFTLLPATLAFLVVGYGVWGGGFEWQAYRVNLQKKREATAMLEALGTTDAVIERLKMQLAKTPKDAKAWFLLGRVYASANDWTHAHEAYTTAHALDLTNESYTLHYAESVWATNHEAFDAETRALLQALLDNNPNQPDALAMLAYDAYTRHLNQDAVHYWERLLTLIDASSTEADQLRKAIAKARST
ncbi:MAG: tetratricopeptide repeat protein [Legionellaceae bacterium]|nr:tetratricopeptide repeat protein [Legionellaceae bacterium]